MLIDFFFKLREAKLPVTIKEYLVLIEGMKAGLAQFSPEEFYYLARTSLVKNEKHFDRFDQVFAAYYKGAQAHFAAIEGQIPEEWLRKLAEKHLTPEEMAEIEALGGWEKLMETLKQRLEEQKERHQGGNKWIGTAGTSPFGAYGYNPEGVRIGQDRSRHRRAVKVWDQRAFKNYDDDVELGTRNIKVALKRLRAFVREGSDLELDLDDTIRSTARNAGWLDLKLVPEKRNKVKVLLFLDVGGSMDDHVKICEELFSAARTELKHLEYYYFHNFIYENVWKDNYRRFSERTPTMDVLNKFGPDYKVIFVGDATMSAYEIVMPGGSVEHWNEESGQVWLKRFTDHFPKMVWLNPEPQQRWRYTESAKITQKLMEDRMYPLTLRGLDEALRYLSR
ncbi:VWA domain-containing protein [Tistrella mobilis]|uniref:vWA domain-containing protein n=1 Tax=Tistrella mobilis TaxID=171437 RepID=UPI003557FC75